MLLKTQTLTIVAPEYLRSEIAAAISPDAGLSAALENGSLLLATDAEEAGDGPVIVVAPLLERFVHSTKIKEDVFFSPTTIASQQLAGFANLSEQPQATVIAEKDLKERPEQATKTIAEMFDRSERARNEARGQRAKPGAMQPNLPHAIQPLTMYAALPVPLGAAAWWSVFAFYTNDGYCPPSIDLMGRARILLHGPYIALPNGVWRADIFFNLSADAAPYDYLVEFGAGGNFARIVYRAETAGQQFLALICTVREPALAEVRISLLRAAFHGELEMEGCWVTRME